MNESWVFLFTDLESSTRLWQQFPGAMANAVQSHEGILRSAIEHAGGRVVKSTGDGLMAVFLSVPSSVAASINSQQGMRDASWGETGPLRVRMGIHVGQAQSRAILVQR